MEAYLVDSVGLKDVAAAKVMAHMRDEYEIDDVQDLAHLTTADLESIIAKTGLKKVPAGKLMVAWKAAYGLKVPADPADTAPPAAAGVDVAAVTATAAPPPSPHPTASAAEAQIEEGFLPGFSDGESSDKRSLRLMYFDDDHDDAEGHRSLIVEREKTSELFENMKGNAILFTVFGEHKRVLFVHAMQ